MNNLFQSLAILCGVLFLLHFSSCSSSKGSELDDKTTLVKTLEEKRAALDQAKLELQESEQQLTALDPNYFKNKANKKARLISTVAVQQKDFEQYTEFQGNIEAKDEYMVSSEVGGIIRSLKVKEGQQIKKGDLIGTVDADMVKRNLDELETSLQLARNTLISQQRLVKDDNRSLQSSVSELEVSIALARDMIAKQQRLHQDNTASLDRGMDEIDVSISLARDMITRQQRLNQNNTASLDRGIDEIDVSLSLARDLVIKRVALIEQDKTALKEQLAELDVALSLAKDVFGRRQKLWDQNIGSEIEFIKSKNDVQSLEQKITSLKAQIAKAGTGHDIELESARKNVESLEKKKATLKAQIRQAGTGDDMQLENAKRNLESLEKKKATLKAQTRQAGTGDDIQLQNAKRNLESLLQKKKTIEAQITQAGTGHDIQVENAQKNVESLEKKKITLQTQLSKTNIYAPASGIIDQVISKQGEVSGPGAPILKLVSTSTLQAVADVPESYLASIKKGDKVMVSLPVLGIEKEATIKNIGALINPKNRTIKIEVNVPNRSGKIKPNLTALVKVKEFGQKEAVIVPTNLVLNDKDGYYVFVVKTDKGSSTKAVKTYVKTGQSYAGETIITEGLTGNEQIVSDGVRMVSNEELVKILN